MGREGERWGGMRRSEEGEKGWVSVLMREIEFAIFSEFLTFDS